jgi:parvulin-like peptidyl-prolyl isomerase
LEGKGVTVALAKRVLSCLLILSLFGVCNVMATETIKKVVIAKVGDISISIFEFQREMHRILPMYSSFHNGISKDKEVEVQQQALQTLVDQAHKVRYAFANEISVSTKELEERMEQVISKFENKDVMAKAMGDETLSDLRSSVYRMMLATKAEEAAVDSQTNYTDEEIRGFYAKNPSMYQLPKQYKVSHILIKIDPTLVGKERDLLYAKAKDLAEKAKAGDDFFNLAYYNSDEDSKFVGGDIGYFYSGRVDKSFESAIKDLEIEEIAGPVETISGLHIVKLTDVIESRAMTFDEVKDNIQKTITDNKRKTLYNIWINALRTQIKPEILHPELVGIL